MAIDKANLDQLVDNIWNATLGLPVEPLLALPTWCEGYDYLTGCIQITGAWEGAVLLDCPLPLARQAASLLFDVPHAEVTPEQISDTLGELTNMTGGNLKALLPPPCFLCLPAVANGSDYALRVMDSLVVTRAAFQCADQALIITVLERDPTRAAPAAASLANRSGPVCCNQ